MSSPIKKTLLLLAAGGLLASTAAGARERISGAKELARMLEDRTAGEPKRCIDNRHGTNLAIIEGTALVYRDGSTLWVNVPADPKSLDDGDAVVIRQFGHQLCSTDVVTTFDPVVGMYTGNVFLNEFVPYRKAG
jgi:hypothetical protein